MNEQQDKSSRVVFWILIIALAAFLCFSMLMNVGLALGMLVTRVASGGSERPVDEFPRLTELWSYGDGDVKAVRIPLEGVIMRERVGGLLAPAHDRVEGVLRQIRAAKHDRRVKAVILEVDSPGGEITPSDEIYQALLAFKQSARGRKVVVFMKDLAASGGYLVSMAGDWLIAEPTAVVGSIGVILQTVNWKEASDKIGIRDTTIKSGDSKDLLNPFREVLPEEREMMQDLVDSMHRHFFQIVQKGRQMDPQALEPLADGRILTAQVALEAGLIDEIGYWDDVVDRVKSLLRERHVKIVRYESRVSFFEWLSRAQTPFRLSSWLDAARPRLMYLWRP